MRVLSCARRDPVHRLAFSADGRFLAANQGTMYHRGIEVFDFAEPDAPTKVLDVQAAEPFFKFLPDRTILVVSEGSLFGFDVTATSAEPFRLVPEVLYPAAAFDVTADGITVVVSRTKPRVTFGYAGYQAWKLRPDGPATQDWAINLTSAPDAIEDATVIVGGGAFLAGQRRTRADRNGYDSLLFVYDLATGKQLRPIRHRPTAEIVQLVSHPGTDRFAARCKKGLVRWRGSSGDPRPVEKFLTGSFTSIAYHPSGRLLAASSEDGTVLLLDADSLTPVKSFAWNVGPLRSVAFSADGTLGAAGSADGRIVVWDAEP